MRVTYVNPVNGFGGFAAGIYREVAKALRPAKINAIITKLDQMF